MRSTRLLELIDFLLERLEDSELHHRTEIQSLSLTGDDYLNYVKIV
jgi:hypothetical protein